MPTPGVCRPVESRHGAFLKEIKRTDQGIQAERAVLVGLLLPGESHGGTRYDPLAELAGLAGLEFCAGAASAPLAYFLN